MKIKNKKNLRKEIVNSRGNTNCLRRINFSPDGSWDLTDWSTSTPGCFSMQIGMFFDVPNAETFDKGLTLKFQDVEAVATNFFKRLKVQP